jgi:hypothetical protein
MEKGSNWQGCRKDKRDMKSMEVNRLHSIKERKGKMKSWKRHVSQSESVVKMSLRQK